MTTSQRPPTIGLDVHYMARGSLDGSFPPCCRAAKITAFTELDTGEIVADLVVFNPQGLYFDQLMTHSSDGTPGTWHYEWECPS